ncbi:glycosyltransferase family 2 protein [candidate division KSB1 bacterium]|nr:glycosyltransferase family 2 protein [candidate division KSB1 bacterium]
MQPRISVVIPAYNAARWLRRAVTSASEQTLRPAEIIIVDDASHDDTYIVAESLAAQHPEIQVFRHDSNRGPAAARNRGIAESRGDYVAFLDADDFWLPEKLAKQAAALQTSSDLGLVFTALQEIRMDGRKIGDVRFRLPKTREGRVAALFLFRLKLITPTMLMPKNVVAQVGGLDESLKYCEDHDLFMRIASAYEIAYVDEILVCRCVVANSTSNAGSPLLIEPHYRRFLQMSLERFPYLQPCAATFEAKLAYQLGRRFQKQADAYQARRYFARSFRTRPSLKCGLAWLTAMFPQRWQSWLGEKPWRISRAAVR